MTGLLIRTTFYRRNIEASLLAGWHINTNLKISQAALFSAWQRRVNYVSLFMFMGIIWCTYVYITERILAENPSSSWMGFIAFFSPFRINVFNSWCCFKTCLYLSYVARPGLNNVCSELYWWSESSSQRRCAWPAAKQLHVICGGLTRTNYFSGIVSLAT